MRLILISSPANLPAKWNKIYATRVAALDALATHELRSNYLKKNGSWGLLKKWLSKASGHKCWYCEAKSTRAPFDVDHFRPKLGVTVNGVRLSDHAGYYWLAYEWSNFRLACQRCNRSENDEGNYLHGKANEFPIEDEAHRCNTSLDQLTSESPKLLDPCVHVDCALLADGIDGEVKPALPAGTWGFERARYTIDQLGLNDWNTPESKRSIWQTLALLVVAVGVNSNQDVVDELKKYLSTDHEYSSFYRAAIGTHRDKAWVEALL